MRLVITTEDNVQLANTDVSGTVWIATYNGWHNALPISLMLDTAGMPAYFQLWDDLMATALIPRTRVANELRFISLDVVLVFPIGEFILRPSYRSSVDNSRGL